MKFLDVHYHAGEDLFLRRESAIEAAAMARDLGGALVLKTHLGSTVDAVLAARDLGYDNLFASLTLNACAGGVDYRVIAREAQKYARVVDVPLLVYLPTITPHKHQRKLSQALAHPCLHDAATTPEAIAVDGVLRTATWEVLRYAKEAPIRLATGHAPKDEVSLLVDAAEQIGLSDLLVTHATHPCVGFTAAEIAQLTGSARHLKIWVEQTALTILLDAAPMDDIQAIARHQERLIFSSDLGQRTTMTLATWLDEASRLCQSWQLPEERWQRITCSHPAGFLGFKNTLFHKDTP